ncbi:MAG: AI-2E family transporter [Actinomycetes bacterium]
MVVPGRMIRRQQAAERPVVVPFGVRLAAAWTWRLAVIAVGVGALLYVVSVFQLIVVPLMVAALVAALLLPAVAAMQRAGAPRAVAAGVALLGGLALVVGLLTLVGTQIATGFGDLQEQAAEGWRQVKGWLATGPLSLSGAQVDEYLAAVQQQVTDNRDRLVSGALRFTSTAGHVVTGFFLVLFASFFFLLDGERIWAWLVGILPADAREPFDAAGRRGWMTLTSYVRAVVLVALVDALGIGLGAALLGVPLVVPLAVLVFLGAFVPIVGATLTGVVAVLVALVAEGPVTALLMLAVVIGVQQLEGHVLQPLLLGRAVQVHPLAVIVAIGAGILVAGVVGALFAVPLVAVLNTVVQSLRETEQSPQPSAVQDDDADEPPPQRAED